jgi:hypothetical protein
MAKHDDDDKARKARRGEVEEPDTAPEPAQPTDAVRSVPDESGARMANEKQLKGVEGGPAFGTARPASAKGTVPRVVQETERAPEGFQRFKIRAENYDHLGPRQTRYVLAKKGDVEGAKKHFLEVSTAGQHVQRRIDAGVKDVEPVVMVVTELPD